MREGWLGAQVVLHLHLALLSGNEISILGGIGGLGVDFAVPDYG